MAVTDTFAKAQLLVTADLGGLKKALNDAERQTKDSAISISRSVNLIKIGFAAAAAAAAAAAVGISTAVAKTAKDFDQLAKDAQRFGLTTQELSAFKLAADLGGQSIESLVTSVRMLSRNMYEAQQGTKEQVEAFAALGVTVTDQDGRLRRSVDVMNDIADRFKAMEDGALKTALAQQVFGRSGSEMIPVLNAGSEAMREAEAMTLALGTAIDITDAKMAEQFNDNLRILQESLKGLMYTVGQALMPALVDITNQTVLWAKANSEVVRSRIAEYTAAIGKAVYAGVFAWEAVKTAIRATMFYAVDAFSKFLAAAEMTWFRFKNTGLQAIEGIKVAYSALMGKLLPMQAEEMGQAVIESLRKIQELKNETFESSEFLKSSRVLAQSLGENYRAELDESAAKLQWFADLGKGLVVEVADKAKETLPDVPEAVADNLEETIVATLGPNIKGQFQTFLEAFAEYWKEYKRIDEEGKQKAKEREELLAEAKKRIQEASLSFYVTTLQTIADVQDQSSRSGFERAKALNIAIATIQTISSAIAAYKSVMDSNIPYPYSKVLAVIEAAAALASGYARVRQIRAQKFTGAAAGGLDEVPATGTMLVHRGEAIVPADPAGQLRSVAGVLPALVRGLSALVGAPRPGLVSPAGTMAAVGGGGGGNVTVELSMTGSESGLQQAILRSLSLRVRDLDERLVSSATKGLSGGA